MSEPGAPDRRECSRVVTVEVWRSARGSVPNEQHVGPVRTGLTRAWMLSGGARRRHPACQTEKEEPQPQVVDAFGLRMTNCAPLTSSL